MPAPGAPVLIRDEEWIVRNAKGVSRDVYCVSVTGTSELVRGKEAKFLWERSSRTVARAANAVSSEAVTVSCIMRSLIGSFLRRDTPVTPSAMVPPRVFRPPATHPHPGRGPDTDVPATATRPNHQGTKSGVGRM